MTNGEVILLILGPITLAGLVWSVWQVRILRKRVGILIERTYELHRGYRMTLDHVKAIGEALEQEQQRQASQVDYEAEHLDRT